MKPNDVLKAREGNLQETPLPLLLNAILAEERTCTLELRHRQLEKRIVFEDGSPVACTSNLLHETLGKYLVEKGKLTEVQYQTALAESISTGTQLGELLVRKQLVAPFDLYKQLQANLAHKILDAFRWSDAKYRLIADAEPSESALRINTAQLILTGTSNLLPFDTVATHLTFVDEQRFTAVATPPPAAGDLKLSGKDARFFQVLRSRPNFGELMQQTGLDVEPAMRKLYALMVLGLADVAENVPTQTATVAPRPEAAPDRRPATPATASTVAAAPPNGAAPPVRSPDDAATAAANPDADDDPAARDALLKVFLEHRTKDPFTLLGVTENVTTTQLKKAFLDAADRFAPLRFGSVDLKEKAETLLIAYARAFSTLVDPEQLALWKQRRKATEERRRTEVKPSTADQFRIRTDLLDSKSQYDEARRRLDANNPRGALEYFEYACDIDAKPIYRAWRAWARYLVDPDANAKLALLELNDVCRNDTAPDEAFRFAGEIHRRAGNYPDAETMYRKAFKLSPQNRQYADVLAQLVKAQKR